MVSLCRPRGLLFVILAGVARKIALGHGTLGIRPLPFPPKPATAFGREHLRWGGIVFSKWMSITLGGLGIYGLYQPFIAKWLFVFNSNFLRMKEAHRSASPSRERFDHPHRPPLALNADARKSVNCDEPNRNRRTTIAIHLTSASFFLWLSSRNATLRPFGQCLFYFRFAGGGFGGLLSGIG